MCCLSMGMSVLRRHAYPASRPVGAGVRRLDSLVSSIMTSVYRRRGLCGTRPPACHLIVLDFAAG